VLLRQEECGDDQLSQASVASTITVRLRIFSGRPDPEWTLDPGAVDEFARRVGEALGGARVNTPPEGGLGYRGFEIRGGRTLGLPNELTVFRGVVSDRSEKAGAHWIDSASLEQLLLDDARGRGLAQLLEAGGASPSPR
jgi:hypothetical protein